MRRDQYRIERQRATVLRRDNSARLNDATIGANKLVSL